MARERDASREAFWRRTLRRFAGSRMTVAEFCATEDLKPTTFYHWQREIKRRGEAPPPESPDPTPQAGLVPVQVVDDLSCPAAVEIVAINGYVIRVRQQATTEQLRRVLQAVDELG